MAKSPPRVFNHHWVVRDVTPSGSASCGDALPVDVPEADLGCLPVTRNVGCQILGSLHCTLMALRYSIRWKCPSKLIERDHLNNRHPRSYQRVLSEIWARPERPLFKAPFAGTRS